MLERFYLAIYLYYYKNAQRRSFDHSIDRLTTRDRWTFFLAALTHEGCLFRTHLIWECAV